MTYTVFLLKKAFKSRLLITSLLLIVIIILSLLAFNIKNKNSETLITNAENQIVFDNKQIKQGLPDRSQANQDNIKLLKKDIKANQHIKYLIHKKQWQSAYKAQISYNNGQLGAENNSKVIDKQLVNLLMSENYRCNFLAKLNLSEQSRTSPTTGISFSIFTDQVISAVLIPLLLIFNLGLLYDKRFARSIDKDSLLPMSIGTNVIQNIEAGIGIALLFVLVVIVTSFISASAISGIGKWHYPIAFFDFKIPFNLYISQGNLIGPILIMRILTVCFIVTFVYFIAMIIKQALPVVLISTIGLIGTNLVTPYFKPLAKLGQYLPTSYFNGVNIVSGQLAHETRNIHFNYINGIISLIVWTIFFLTMIYLIMKIKQRSFDTNQF